MPSITSLLRALGNDRALANVQAVLEERQREEWLVAGLVRRLDQRAALAGGAAQDVPAGSGVRTHATA